jgi:hypothetical protein
LSSFDKKTLMHIWRLSEEDENENILTLKVVSSWHNKGELYYMKWIYKYQLRWNLTGLKILFFLIYY